MALTKARELAWIQMRASVSLEKDRIAHPEN
jgi:hypothetical protein